MPAMEFLSRLYIPAEAGDNNGHLHHTDSIDQFQDHRAQFMLESGLALPLPRIRSYRGRFLHEVLPDSTATVRTRTEGTGFEQEIFTEAGLATRMISWTTPKDVPTPNPNTHFRTQSQLIHDLPVKEGQLSQASHLSLYETQRALLAEDLDIDLEDLRAKKLLTFIRDFGGQFTQPVTLGDEVTIYSSVVDKKTCLRFEQWMTHGKQIASNFWCQVYLVPDGPVKNALPKLPREIRAKIAEANQVKYLAA